MTQSDKGLAKIAEGASPRRHAETNPVKVKDTSLMNNKLPPAEIICVESGLTAAMYKKYQVTTSCVAAGGIRGQDY